MEHGLKCITFYVQKHIAALAMCYNPSLVCDKAARRARICETHLIGWKCFYIVLASFWIHCETFRSPKRNIKHVSVFRVFSECLKYVQLLIHHKHHVFP